MIQPIETRYDGYRFRSRLEARWAVFFKRLGLKYEYEKEGYIVPTSPWSGNTENAPYLPDFWLPELHLFVEVKGREPTEEELALCCGLHLVADYPALIVWGLPRDFKDQHRLYITDIGDSSGGLGEWDNCEWAQCAQCRQSVLWIPTMGDRAFCLSSFESWRQCACSARIGYPTIASDFLFQQAAEAASYARFEHGEKGTVAA